MAVTKDSLGDRMKKNYEDRTRVHLPRRTWTIIRVDGRAFHTYTRDCQKPFDAGFMRAMDDAAIELCGEIMGCRGAYGQSDEYSFVMTDFETINTESWFDGNVQKTVSVAASIFTSEFNRVRLASGHRAGAAFDARVFTIPDPVEVENYFIWRQQDCTRNAIQSAGYAEFSQKQLHQLNTDQIQEKLFQERQINFNDYPAKFKRGRVVWKETYEGHFSEMGGDGPGQTCTRTRWVVDCEAPVFTQDRDYLRQKVLQIQPVSAEVGA